jgi:predicted AlkP superfamily phosphohydrolase/phosphomutase
MDVGGEKVLMVGIDAADIDFIRSSLGALPRLRQLFAGGRLRTLRSTADVLTSSVWPTFSTGMLPGEHGVYYPMQWHADAMTLRRVAVDWIPFEPFWYPLARRGVRVAVLDVPFSLPSRLGQGVEIQNWGSHEHLAPFQCNRPDVRQAIRSRFGRHPMGREIPVEETPARLNEIRRNLVAGARCKGELSRWLMETTEWDLFITVFGECHRGGHVLWPEPRGAAARVPQGALLDVYQAVDQAIGGLLDRVDPGTTTVIVFSLHGMGPNYTQEHFLLPVMERINAGFLGGEAPRAGLRAVRASPMRALRDLVPGRLQYLLAKAAPDGVRDWVVRRTYCGGLDWNRTPGFAIPGSGEGYLRYNLAGREPAGILGRDGEGHGGYERWLRDCFATLRDAATRAPLVKDIVSSGELYPGLRRGHLPDLVVLWHDLAPAAEICSERLGRFTGRLATGRTGEHRPAGFAVLEGSGRGLDQAPPLQHITDFADVVGSLLSPPDASRRRRPLPGRTT